MKGYLSLEKLKFSVFQYYHTLNYLDSSQLSIEKLMNEKEGKIVEAQYQFFSILNLQNF